MILLDTNVISEPMRRQPDAAILRWLDEQEPATLFLSTVSLAEVLTGIETAPEGKFKQGIQAGMAALIENLFGQRILPFDEVTARAYAAIQANVKRVGRHVGVADGQIAATALVRGFTVATRDVRPYELAGLEVINPWERGESCRPAGAQRG